MAKRRKQFKENGLAERLQRARAASGLSARELSLRAKLAEGHVSLIEKRRRKNIDMGTAKKLAGVLCVSWIWLLSGEGDAPTNDQIREAAGDD